MLKQMLLGLMVAITVGCAAQVAPTRPTPKAEAATQSATPVNLANVFTQEVFERGVRPAASPAIGGGGWTQRPLKFEVQHPYDLKLAERYSYDAATDVQDLWVFGTDKAHLPPPNKTTARTELRLVDPEYKQHTGLHMMECDLYIVPGTFSAISQVFATGPMAMIVADPAGTISDLRTHEVLGKNMNANWFHWAVVHDTDVVGNGAINIYIDGKLVASDLAARASPTYYFKVGVYSRHGSDKSEVKIRNLRVWQK